MTAHASKSPSTLGRHLAGLCFAAVASAPALALAVPGNTAEFTLLAEGLNTPTTVALRNGNAFVPEGRLGQAGILGHIFTVREISLQGAGILSTVLLPGQDFFPEGIALDPVSNDLFVGSIFQGEIATIADGATKTLRFSDRVGAGALQRGAVGTRVDANLGLLWVCDTNFGLNIAGGAVVGLDIDDATEVVRHELPAGSFCNDIIIEADGDLLVAETLVGQIFRIDVNETLIDNSAQLFLQTAELAPPAAGQLGANGLGVVDGILFVSNTFAGTLVRFDLNAADIAGSVQIVTLREGNNANLILSGPDGFLPISDTQALVVENGFAGAGRNALGLVTFDAI
jgi:hypothetical protein